MGVTYIPVARVGELAAGAMKEVDLGGRQVLLAFVEGKYFAFSRQCPHEEADLKTRDTRRRQGSLHQSQLLLRSPDRRVCFAQRGSAVDGSAGGRAGRRGLHPAGVVESQT